MENINKIIDVAIKKEEYSYELYKKHANLVENAGAKVMLNELADEELKHKAVLADLKNKSFSLKGETQVADLKLDEFFEDAVIDASATLQDVLIFAIKQEKVAQSSYAELANNAEAEEVKNLFNGLSAQEAAHALKLEQLYDDEIYKDN